MSQYVQTPPPQIPGAQAPLAQTPKKKSGCLKLILIAAVILVILIIIGIFKGGGSDGATGKPVDPDVTLKQAEANIVSSGDGVAYSNSEAGNKLAAAFSKEFKVAALEGTDAIKDSHEFITHCQLNKDSVLFLVHVPKLRKFEKESKERFCEIGWVIAHSVLLDAGMEPGIELAVGVKGVALYQNIYLGKYDPVNLLDLEGDIGVSKKTKEKSEIESFFKGAPEEPAEDEKDLETPADPAPTSNE